MREKVKINEGWRFVKLAESEKQALEQSGETVCLPHTWNAKDGQDGGNDYYRGTCWYIKELPDLKTEDGGEIYLEFEGVAMTSEVFIAVNSDIEKLAHHEGGYSTFRVNLTESVKKAEGKKLTVIVSADNSANDRVYPQNADFTFYGGIYRDVNIIKTPETHFALDYFGTPAIKVTPSVTLLPDGGNRTEILLEAWVKNDDKPITVVFSVGGLTARSQTDANGYVKASMTIENARLWNGKKDPYLYTAKAETENDTVETRFGCRTFKIDPQKGFLLNGESYPLRGVSRHQDRAEVGSALSPEMHREDMDIILEMGANTIRLAHYQHSGYFYDLCDEKGIIVWAEIPYITMHMQNGVQNTLDQMKELVVQNYNHPSIICWGLSNEITAASSINEELLDNHRRLNELCHSLDSTRPTTMANVFMLEQDSPILEVPDINSYNLYFGWYLGELGQNDEFFDEYHDKYPERAIGFSEYGADANPDFHSGSPEKGDYSEEYQCVYHEHILKMIESRPYLWATHVWNMFDFAADGRDEGGKHGINQKGLVTIDRKIKKDAFYLYKAHWSEEPFVHLAGRRYKNRAETITNVKVYSNRKEIELYLDDKLFEKKSGSRIFSFEVPISGEHKIRAVSGGLSDEIIVCKTEKPDPEYALKSSAGIKNWFEDIAVDASCYSVYDTLGELAKNPQANAIVQAMMDSASASRGDVAQSVKDNPALQRMMARMTVISLLKQAGGAVPEEAVKQLNAALQQIKKRV